MQRSEGAVINPFCVNPTMQSRIENYPQQPVVVVVVVVVVCVSGGGGRRTHSTVLEPHSHSLLLSTEARPDGFICCFGPLFCRLESSATLSVRPEKKRLKPLSTRPVSKSLSKLRPPFNSDSPPTRLLLEKANNCHKSSLRILFFDFLYSFKKDCATQARTGILRRACTSKSTRGIHVCCMLNRKNKTYFHLRTAT